MPMVIEKKKRVRGSVWTNETKRFQDSVGSYFFTAPGDRAFMLTAIKTGVTRVYESPAAATADGWRIIQRRK